MNVNTFSTKYFEHLETLLPFDFFWATRILPKTSNKDLNVFKHKQGKYKVFTPDELLLEVSVCPRDFKFWNTIILPPDGDSIFNGYDFRKLRMDNTWIKILSDHFKFQSALITEIMWEGEKFQFIFFKNASDFYSDLHKTALNELINTFEIIIDKIIYGKIPSVEKEITIIREPRQTIIQKKDLERPAKFNGIIGNSPLLLGALAKLEAVAPDETSVLILGESGTGKEKIAHALHNLSPRKLKPFITINCAALPLTLIESELFGHEKGAFTGANEKRIGKFEQADGGSIFLDEIGELPLEAQTKLLRVLQEKEIERVGGNMTKKINVRIITATNRNLEREVSEGKFRLDLYYRLNVFPIELPALKQRKEDIPLLVNYFIDKYTQNSPNHTSKISDSALAMLQLHDWPGNIRELEHLIARTMILNGGNYIENIEIPSSVLFTLNTDEETPRIKTMEEMEREHILYVLKVCNGKVFGPGGAAEALNIPSTTLNSKIKKLGIRHEFV